MIVLSEISLYLFYWKKWRVLLETKTFCACLHSGVEDNGLILSGKDANVRREQQADDGNHFQICIIF